MTMDAVVKRRRGRPSKITREQVLAGCFPVAQLREPFSAVRLLAERAWPRLQHAYGLDAYMEQVGVDAGPAHACAVSRDTRSCRGAAHEPPWPSSGP